MFRCILILILLTGKLIAQPKDIISAEKTNLKTYEIVYSNYYDGKSLWGYMDGGADLYLEYGFDGLLVQEIKYKGVNIKCEIFKMNDPGSAFGIFSIQRSNCNSNNEIEGINCIHNYQVQISIGDYYLSFVNQTGDSVSKKISIEVASAFSHIIEKEKISFPEFRNNFFAENPNLIYIKGKIALGNVYPQALDNLENISGYNFWLIPSEGKSKPSVSIITFENSESLKQYEEVAFPAQSLTQTSEIALKKGDVRIGRMLNEGSILQAEGRKKEIKKMLLF